jgi:putative transposase
MEPPQKPGRIKGRLVLVAIVDGCSRLAVGYAMGEHPDAELAVGAVELAVWRRGLADGDGDGGLIYHSDKGSQFTSLAFGKRLERLGIRASTGSVGDCFDHALAESFFATLECELIDRRHWRTREQARVEVFYWIEAVYNRTRRHSSLGYLSPIEYEASLSKAPSSSNPSR